MLMPLEFVVVLLARAFGASVGLAIELAERVDKELNLGNEVITPLTNVAVIRWVAAQCQSELGATGLPLTVNGPEVTMDL